MTGLVSGLREAGVDLALADRIVGTSAGAVVGSMLASGADVARLADPMDVDAPSFEVDLELVNGGRRSIGRISGGYDVDAGQWVREVPGPMRLVSSRMAWGEGLK
jgi:hypothetical protein